MEVCCENPADHVFVDVDTECQGDLLGNPLAAPSAIAPLHFNDRVDSLRNSPTTGSVGVRKRKSSLYADAGNGFQRSAIGSIIAERVRAQTPRSGSLVAALTNKNILRRIS